MSAPQAYGSFLTRRVADIVEIPTSYPNAQRAAAVRVVWLRRWWRANYPQLTGLRVSKVRARRAPDSFGNVSPRFWQIVVSYDADADAVQS